MEKTADKISWKTHWRIDKFRDPDDEVAKALHGGLPTAEALRLFKDAFVGNEEWDANVALDEGLQELIDIICGLGTPTKWDNTNARLGVGDSNTAEAATQTGLQAATNKTYKAMDASYPQRSNQTAEWRATFGTSDANYAWEEYTVVNAASDSGKNLNRKISSKGTKASGETWTLSLQITFS
jgi:uncharacterized cupin superfamily protein